MALCRCLIHPTAYDISSSSFSRGPSAPKVSHFALATMMRIFVSSFFPPLSFLLFRKYIAPVFLLLVFGSGEWKHDYSAPPRLVGWLVGGKKEERNKGNNSDLTGRDERVFCGFSDGKDDARKMARRWAFYSAAKHLMLARRNNITSRDETTPPRPIRLYNKYYTQPVCIIEEEEEEAPSTIFDRMTLLARWSRLLRPTLMAANDLNDSAPISLFAIVITMRARINGAVL